MNAQLVNPKEFNTVQEYKAAMNLVDVEGEWMEVARHLGVEIDPKGGKRSLYKAWKAQNGDQPEEKAKPVSTKVKATIVQAPVVNTVSDVVPAPQPEPVIVDAKPKTKMPRRVDFQSEEEHSAAMTEWMLANPKPESKTAEQAAKNLADISGAKKQTTKSIPVADAQVSDDNIDETAIQLAKLLAGLKPKGKGSTNADDIMQIVTSQLTEFEERIEDKYSSVVTNGFTKLLDAAKDLIINELIKAKNELAGNTKTIHVKVNDSAAVKIDGLVHERFEDILSHVSVRDHVMLVGPAGSGKTTVCENVAQALSLDFYCKSVCAQTSKSELLGYMDANGNFVTTEFRKAYELGGVFVLDEIDAGNPNVIAVLNSALANNYCAFADQMVRKHEDFVLIACANTYGTGASREYVGRNQLDSATLDRFSVIDFGYDEKLEMDLSPDKKFCAFVQAVRRELTNERVVISPRASIQGGKLLAAGKAPRYVMQTRLIKGMSSAMAERVKLVFSRHYN